MLIVRHGESTWNAVRRWQGQADPPLTERGENQARRGGAAVGVHGPFEAVVTSNLQRARRTGELVSEASDVALGDQYVALGERDAGEWEGLTRAQIEERDPGYLEAERRPPGYESDESIVERAGRALREIAQLYPGGSVLIVSHGGIIHALERAFSDSDKWQRLDNLTGRWFEVDGDSIEPVGERIALVADGGPPAPPPDSGYA